MKADPVIDEIRKVRDEISRECGYEPRKLVNYYKRLQNEESSATRKRRPAARGNREKFEAALAKVPAAEPLPGDE
jgi:hypothetical protein